MRPDHESLAEDHSATANHREQNQTGGEPQPSSTQESVLTAGGEMGKRIRAFDWSKTPLGAIESWSPALRTLVRIMLANRFPLLLWWGPQYISIYNDAYIPVLGEKHPWALGKPVSECWKEIWHILQPLIDTPFKGGPATWNDDIFLEINRYGFVEETHFTIAYSPVPDETVPSGIGGVLATVHEITENVIGERRISTLRDLGARVGEARTAEEACRIAAEILAGHDKDIPFVLLYLIEEGGKQCRLAGAAGVAMNEQISPLVVDLRESQQAGWPLGIALRTEIMQVVETLGERFSSVPSGPWSDPSHTAIVVPIPSNKAHEPAGLMVAGVSARLKFDQLYKDFIDLVRSQVATAIANARVYEEERRRAEALAEIDRAKTAFFANISHEFRTPLTLMMGPLEDALSDKEGLSVTNRERLELAHRNALRQLKLVNTLLDFARIEAGRIEANYEPVDLASYTAELASVFRSAIEHAGLKLIVNCPPLAELVFIDREMWEKIVLNLLSNAFKFTFEGEIEVSLGQGNGQVQLAVRDTGVGIPAHELPQIFERFHRVRGAQSRTYEGTGIGLALVQELVHLHGGRIDVKSAENKGTIFTISIPTGTAHLPADRISSTRTASTLTSTPMLNPEAYVQEVLSWLPEEDRQLHVDRDRSSIVSEKSPKAPASGQFRILLVDDNADMRTYIQRLLSQNNYDVAAVADGLAALRIARDWVPDLVVSDVMMPGLDGFGLLRELRADPATAMVPVIMLSARAGEEARVEGMEAGADDYLVKPFSARELLARVKAHLEIAHIRNEAEERYRGIVNQSVGGILEADSTGRFTTVNDHFCEITGYTREELMHLRMQDITHPEDLPRHLELLGNLAAGGPPYEIEKRYIRKDGSIIWVHKSVSAIRAANGKAQSLVAVVIDITKHKQTEQALQQLNLELENMVQSRTARLRSANQSLRDEIRERIRVEEELSLSRDRLRELSRRLVEVQEEERRALARELHDRAGQTLSALNINLIIMNEQILGDSRKRIGSRLEDSMKLTAEAIALIRNVMSDLRPAVLDDYGLRAALKSYIEEYGSRYGIQAELDQPESDLPRLESGIAMTILRIVQEALTNVVRHAQATQVQVSIRLTDHTIHLTVQDNGIGISNGQGGGHPNSHGLKIMRERAEAFGGSVIVEPAPLRGTRLEASIPIHGATITDYASGSF